MAALSGKLGIILAVMCSATILMLVLGISVKSETLEEGNVHYI